MPNGLETQPLTFNLPRRQLTLAELAALGGINYGSGPETIFYDYSPKPKSSTPQPSDPTSPVPDATGQGMAHHSGTGDGSADPGSIADRAGRGSYINEGGIGAGQGFFDPGVAGMPSAAGLNAGTIGGGVGTLAGLIGGIPGLGLIGSAIGTGIERSAYKDYYGGSSSPFGAPSISYGSALLNNITFGLLGTSAATQGARDYQKRSGTSLNEAALNAAAKAATTGKTYSGPKGVVGPRGGGGGIADPGAGRGRQDARDRAHEGSGRGKGPGGADRGTQTGR